MPELPEAETIARALDRTLKKRKIKKVEVFVPKLRTPLKPLCTAKLEGREFTGCHRRHSLGRRQESTATSRRRGNAVRGDEQSVGYGWVSLVRGS